MAIFKTSGITVALLGLVAALSSCTDGRPRSPGSARAGDPERVLSEAPAPAPPAWVEPLVESSPEPTPDPTSEPIPHESSEPVSEPSTLPTPSVEPVGSPEFPIRTFPLAGCEGGRGHVAEFDFGDPVFAARFEVRVIKTRPVKMETALADLRSRGLSVAALLNAGYFDMASGIPVSYYRSSLENAEHPGNSVRSPRACVVWSPEGAEVLQSTNENYRNFRQWPDAEIICAGPQVLFASTDVSRTRACDEQFTDSCRSDHSDGGLNYSSKYPRAGVCLAGPKKMLFFSFESPVRKCGVTIPAMAQAMLDAGCTDGINLDGGGSVKLFLDNGTNLPVQVMGAPGDRSRGIPVWISVVRRAAP